MIMKKIILSVLILVLTLLPIVSLYSCDDATYLHTIVGEIAYVKSDENHMVYIAPHAQAGITLWIPMMITPETETASEFNKEAGKMPELSIGNIVEIVYNAKGTKANHILVGGSQVISLKVKSSAEGLEMQDFDLKLRRGYEYSRLEEIGTRDYGTVVHIAKIEKPDNGYFIYVDNNKYDEYDALTVYWLDEDSMYMESGGVLIDDGTIALVESGATGFYAEINSFELYRFKNVGIQTIHSIAAKSAP